MATAPKQFRVALGRPVRGLTYADARSMCDDLVDEELPKIAACIQGGTTMSPSALRHTFSALVASGELLLLENMTEPFDHTGVDGVLAGHASRNGEPELRDTRSDPSSA
ncbi:MAG: hypothetical protein JKY37_12060 [Nannocystaceae bacterium]|nr:hypothetical protein [Nannocystaceae bacterium]